MLLYELVLSPPRLTRPALMRPVLMRWIGHEGRFAAASALTTAVYLAGKLSGTGALYNMPGYRPEYSPRYLLRHLRLLRGTVPEHAWPGSLAG